MSGKKEGNRVKYPNNETKYLDNNQNNDVAIEKNTDFAL